MNLVPVIGKALLGAVLTHGRNRNAVAQGHIFQAEGGKQVGHIGTLEIDKRKSGRVDQYSSRDGRAVAAMRPNGVVPSPQKMPGQDDAAASARQPRRLAWQAPLRFAW